MRLSPTTNPICLVLIVHTTLLPHPYGHVYILVLSPSTTYRALRAGACLALRELHLRNNDVRGEGLRELLGWVTWVAWGWLGWFCGFRKPTGPSIH